MEYGCYIERNPLKAHLVEDPTHYPWSSAAYYGLGKEDCLVTENALYAELGQNPVERRKEYRKFLVLHDPYEAAVDRLFFKQ